MREVKTWSRRGARGSAAVARLALGLLPALAGCVREPVERLCPEVAAGELVVSELRAGKRGSAEVSWIELWNGGAQEIDLLGAAVRWRRLDGGAEQRALVRRSVPVAPGAHVVLGQVVDEARPAWLAYGFAADAPAPFYAAAAVEVESCERLVDRMTYAQLPARGSLALGDEARSALGNDAAAAWCADASAGPPPGGDDGGRGGESEDLVGTPGRANPPCR